MSTIPTIEMAEAERELDARVEFAYGRMRDAQARGERLAGKLAAKDAEPLSDEDVRRMEKFLRGYGKTPEWVKVVERIERGHLTWRQVVESLDHDPIDPDVNAAFRSLSALPPASPEDLVAMGVLPPLPASETPQVDGEPRPQAPRARRPRRDEAEDDDFFENITAVDRKKR